MAQRPGREDTGDRGQSQTSFDNTTHNIRQRQTRPGSLTSFHYRRSASRSWVRRRSRAFPSSFLPLPSAPQPQNASLSEFYTTIRKCTWGISPQQDARTSINSASPVDSNSRLRSLCWVNLQCITVFIYTSRRVRVGVPQGNEKVNVPR